MARIRTIQRCRFPILSAAKLSGSAPARAASHCDPGGECRTDRTDKDTAPDKAEERRGGGEGCTEYRVRNKCIAGIAGICAKPCWLGMESCHTDGLRSEVPDATTAKTRGRLPPGAHWLASSSLDAQPATRSLSALSRKGRESGWSGRRPNQVPVTGRTQRVHTSRISRSEGATGSLQPRRPGTAGEEPDEGVERRADEALPVLRLTRGLCPLTGPTSRRNISTSGPSPLVPPPNWPRRRPESPNRDDGDPSGSTGVMVTTEPLSHYLAGLAGRGSTCSMTLANAGSVGSYSTLDSSPDRDVADVAAAAAGVGCTGDHDNAGHPCRESKTRAVGMEKVSTRYGGRSNGGGMAWHGKSESGEEIVQVSTQQMGRTVCRFHGFGTEKYKSSEIIYPDVDTAISTDATPSISADQSK
ncbi:hypothetical protein T310_5386 [Rasamsonia emersonii CBS 393.64]|uniref:Uncharacterized protein n=1 Tax=Rasamsonia emersonii (strain ATCC 16479 / CBS 393.64 / IMI 116815) TaxID=1408163 RepID=A0A0F4YR75_RASE3|nr:hypothetical protein T310_5386 [Rasamsonia emersonii CBS 393.64]KKA20610.1 hypothetical protein T310_5386 [Rasamsonia emersonii CBS 393.64]